MHLQLPEHAPRWAGPTPRRAGRQGVIALLAVLALLAAGVLPTHAAEGEPGPLPFEVTARAAVLMDVHTGKILYVKNADERIPPASLTKVMTMVLALDALAEGQVTKDTEVVISEAAWRLVPRGSAMFLEVGERVPFENLLYGIGVQSGNDASLAVAEHLAGSEEAFVSRMNQRAQELGLTSTRFANSHGLPGGEQYTTARDQAVLASVFVSEYAQGLPYMATTEYTWAGINQRNRNGLLFRDERVTGLKTGFLSVSGYHLVATAEHGEMSLVAAVLGAASEQVREQEALSLLNYGFQTYTTLTLPWGEAGQRVLPVFKGGAGQVRVRPAEALVVTIPRAAADRIEVVDDLPDHVEAPVAAGQLLGTVTVRVDGEAELAVPLTAADEVPRGSLFKVLVDSLRLFFGGLGERLLGD